MTGDYSGWDVKTEKGWQAYHEGCWLAEQKEDFDDDAAAAVGDGGVGDDLHSAVVDGDGDDDNQFL